MDSPETPNQLPDKNSNPITTTQESENRSSINPNMDSKGSNEPKLSPTSAYNAAIAKRAGYGDKKGRSISGPLGPLNGKNDVGGLAVFDGLRSSSLRLTLGGGKDEAGGLKLSNGLRSSLRRPSLVESRNEVGGSTLFSGLRSSLLHPSLSESKNDAGTTTVSSNRCSSSSSWRPSLAESRNEPGLSRSLRSSSVFPSPAYSRNDPGLSTGFDDSRLPLRHGLSSVDNRNDTDASTLSRSLRSSSCRPDPARSRNDPGFSKVAMGGRSSLAYGPSPARSRNEPRPSGRTMGPRLASRDSTSEHTSMNDYRTERDYSYSHPSSTDTPSGFANRNDDGPRRPASDNRSFSSEVAPGFASRNDSRVGRNYSNSYSSPWNVPDRSVRGYTEHSWEVSIDTREARRSDSSSRRGRNLNDFKKSYSHPRSAFHEDSNSKSRSDGESWRLHSDLRSAFHQDSNFMSKSDGEFGKSHSNPRSAFHKDSNSISRSDGESWRPHSNSRSAFRTDSSTSVGRNGIASGNQHQNSRSAQQTAFSMSSGKRDSGSRASSATSSATVTHSPPQNNMSANSNPMQQGKRNNSESMNNNRQAEATTGSRTRSSTRNISSRPTSNRHLSDDSFSAEPHSSSESDSPIPVNKNKKVSISQRFSAERRSSATASMNRPAPFFGKHGSLAQNWVEAGPKASIVNANFRAASRSGVMVRNEMSRSQSPRGSAVSFRGRENVPNDEGHSRGGSSSRGYGNVPNDQGHSRGGSSSRPHENDPDDEGHSRASHPPPQRDPSTLSFQRVSIDSLPKPPVRQDKHILTPVTTHTNKCDYCPNHNTTVYQRCNACNAHFCKSCLRKCRDGKHEVDVEMLNWIPDKDKAKARDKEPKGTGKGKEKEVPAIDRKGKGKEIESSATPSPTVRGVSTAPRINPAYLEPLANNNRSTPASEPTPEDDWPEVEPSDWNCRGYPGIEKGLSLNREPEISTWSGQSYTPPSDRHALPPTRSSQPPSATPSKRPTSTRPETESPGPLIKRAKVVEEGSSTNQPSRGNSAEHDTDATLDDPMTVEDIAQISAPSIKRAEAVDEDSSTNLLNRADSAGHDTDATIDDPAVVDDTQNVPALQPSPPRLLVQEPQPTLKSQQVQLTNDAPMDDPMVVDDARTHYPHPSVAWGAHPQLSPEVPKSAQVQLAIEAPPSKEAEVLARPKKRKLKLANVKLAFAPEIQAKAAERAKAREAEKARLAAEEEARKAAEEERRLAAEHAEKLEELNRFTRHVWATAETLVEYLENGDLEGALQYISGVRVLDAMKKGIKLPPDEDICVILGLNVFEEEDEDEVAKHD